MAPTGINEHDVIDLHTTLVFGIVATIIILVIPIIILVFIQGILLHKNKDCTRLIAFFPRNQMNREIRSSMATDDPLYDLPHNSTGTLMIPSVQITTETTDAAERSTLTTNLAYGTSAATTSITESDMIRNVAYEPMGCQDKNNNGDGSLDNC